MLKAQGKASMAVVPVEEQAVVQAPADTDIVQEQMDLLTGQDALCGADGAIAGIMGGRRRVPLEDRRGIYGQEDRSNRLAPGLHRRRKDWDPGEALQIIKFLKESMKAFADEESYWRSMVRRYRPLTKKMLQALLDKEGTFTEKL